MTGIARTIVANNTGILVGEIDPGVESIEWRIGIGEMKMTFSRRDPKAIPDYIEFGNRIYVEFTNGLPVWGGVIDPPRKWSKGNITVTAYSGEALLGFRTTGKTLRFNGSPVGVILQRLITDANAAEEMGLRPGDIWEEGDQHYPAYHFRNMWDIVKDSISSRLSKAEIAVVPVVEGGRIWFDVHLYERRGRVRDGVVLADNRNATNISLDERGPIINEWNLAGADTGSTTVDGWGETRITAKARNKESIGRYGLRQGGETDPEITQQETLDRHANNLVDKHGQPKNIWSLKALNRKPGTFAQYNVGDTVGLHAPGYGFGEADRFVRMINRTYHPSSGLCDLTVKEVGADQ